MSSSPFSLLRLSLSAVTSGARLTPTALDPVLVKVVGMLSSNG